MASHGETKARAIAVASELVQRHGYEGFSFQHVADALRIKKPSLYAHFSSKEDLGQHILREALTQFAKWAEARRSLAAAEQVAELFVMFKGFASARGKLCPLSSFGGGHPKLPPRVKLALDELYAFERDWLRGVIVDGQREKVFRRDLSPVELADMILSMGLGSQFGARLEKKPAHVDRVKKMALKILMKS